MSPAGLLVNASARSQCAMHPGAIAVTAICPGALNTANICLQCKATYADELWSKSNDVLALSLPDAFASGTAKGVFAQ